MALYEKRKLLVCGSRTITDKEWIFSQIESYWYWNLACYKFPVMIEGEARGVDSIAKDYAVENEWEIEAYPAEWDKYGKSAGYIRNEIMVKACDECLILWDGSSKGTKHDIDLCEKYKKPYKVLIYNENYWEKYVDKKHITKKETENDISTSNN